MISDLKNDCVALKAEIANTNLFKTGLVHYLINKVYYYQGQISVIGDGTWVYLHDLQDTLIEKIKSTGQDRFTIPEHAGIDSFATDAAQSKIEHPTILCCYFLEIESEESSVLKLFMDIFR